MPKTCDKCGRGMIISSEKFVGWPYYHVKGTRVEYCGFCDIPPVMTLTSLSKRSYDMVLDNDNACTN